MSDETPGVSQGALPPVIPRPGVERPAVRLTQVASGQFVISPQSHGLQQISSIVAPGAARIINISPSSRLHTSPLRPSQSNQTIVSALTGSSSVRLQLFPTNDRPRSPNKRTVPEQIFNEDLPTKRQKILEQKKVKLWQLRERYHEHGMELYFLQNGGNMLDFPTFIKRPKTQQCVTFLRQYCVDLEMEDASSSEVLTENKVSPPVVTPIPQTTASVAPVESSQPPPFSTNNATSDVIATTKQTQPLFKQQKVTSGFPASTNQEQIVEKAKQEAYVMQRVTELQKEGLWSEKRLPKVQETPKSKAHWDFLLEEMVWLAADFAQERKWKKAAAKKCARMVQKYFQDKAMAAQKAEKAQELQLKRIAAFVAKEIKQFWLSAEKLVEFKQQTRLEEKRKKALDQHLSFIVDQTEKYSQQLAEGMNKAMASAATTEGISSASRSPDSRIVSDDEFQPGNQSSSDDEETIAQAEASIDQGGQHEEVAALQRESKMDFEDFLNELPKDYLENRDKINLNEHHSSSEGGDGEDSDDEPLAKTKIKEKQLNCHKDSKTVDKEDDEFVASSEEDDEDTIQEQEEVEGDGSHHKEELDDLNAENEMSIEELRRKYRDISEHPIPESDSDSSNVDVEDDSSHPEGSDEDSNECSEDDDDDYMDFDESKDDDFGLKSLLDDGTLQSDNSKSKNEQNDDLINDAAAIAESIQPKGNTLSSTSVVTPVPFLLKLPLREYQHIGLDWLVTMFERKLNGILADEMGLGKTIQTIALLAHLACEKGDWGPHLIIVPTSVMLNWEMECKKWCPGFKILTYYGTQKERKQKRTGWTKPNAFHICITSYKLVIQDHQSFRRKKWKYLILDEAQNIKNFKSQRWQLLLNFQSRQRLLLTGTPLQNNLMELWSLMHFLMPHVFQSHREFKEWFSNPVTGMIEGNSEYNESIIKRLHKVLRPFLLRRLKCEVEKQMPKKYEHVVMCRLSKRQRFLYDDFMSRAKTRETLASGNLLSVINVLMQLRKVCNHPNLFEVRPTVSPFQCEGIVYNIPSIVYSLFEYLPYEHIKASDLNLNLIDLESNLSAYTAYCMYKYQTPRKMIQALESLTDQPPQCPSSKVAMRVKMAGTQQQGSNKGLPITSTTASSTSTSPMLNLTTFKSHEGLSLPAGFAQLVQTSTGKHILLTPSSTLSSSVPVTGSATVLQTSSGQRLTVLTKPVSNVQTDSLNLQNSFENADIGVKRPINSKFIEEIYSRQPTVNVTRWELQESPVLEKYLQPHEVEDRVEKYTKNKLNLLCSINDRRCSAIPMYGTDLQDAVTVVKPSRRSAWSQGYIHCKQLEKRSKDCSLTGVSDALRQLVHTPANYLKKLEDITNRFLLYVPAVMSKRIEKRVLRPCASKYWAERRHDLVLQRELSAPCAPLHKIASAMVTQFPDPRLIQYDCGKLQTLDILLRKLKNGAHRVLIFTQMTRMLDVLEAFLNFHGHIYLRLDGTTKVDQRQVLMERFNGDKRIFVFILSTRSGGVGVNLTGADTVIFYDSDWNPTMDAQAQDRCHRIGQTRDVHIYRLVSEKTIEENILKKANQKRMLGDLAIEGGNFTTAYFKSSTIQDLFSVNTAEESAETRMAEVVNARKEREKMLEVSTTTTIAVPGGSNGISSGGSSEEKVAMGALENALAACEDDQDVQAARTAKAEAVADLAEFDESIPLEDQKEADKPEISKAEQEMENLVKQLKPIERYAMHFVEDTEAAWSAEQLAAAEKEIEDQKREWERNRLAALREEEQRRSKQLEEDAEILTFSREDSSNQVWLSDNTNEQMPMWGPPTPPHQNTDVYIDHSMSLLYETSIMPESQLPPVYVRKESKRSRHDAAFPDSRRAMKVPRKDDSTYPPRSLFDRSSLAVGKMRRDIKLQKYRGIIRAPVPVPGMKVPPTVKPQMEPPWHPWTVHEDMALLKVIQTFQGLPLNLMIVSPGHTPNWDFVADYVNSTSITHRSPKQCKHRYDSMIIPREEGKLIYETARKKKTKGGSYKYPTQTKSNRPMRTSQLYNQDNNATFSKMMIQRYDQLKSISNKRAVPARTTSNNPQLKNPRHAAVLTDCGIDLDHPVLPVEVAARRAERLQREKLKAGQISHEQQLLAQKVQAANANKVVAQPSTSTIQQAQTIIASSPSISSPVRSAASPMPQTIVVSQAATTVVSTVVVTPTTSIVNAQPTAVRLGTRIISSSPLPSTVVSLSGLTPAQLQGATQRLIVTGTGQTKTLVGNAIPAGKAINQAQLQLIRQNQLKQQLRLQTAASIAAQGGKTTVTVAGTPSTVQLVTQGQILSQRAQILKQAGTVAVAGKQGIATRAMSESEMTALVKHRQQQLQQQKLLAAASAAGQTAQLQGLTQTPVLAQFQVAGPSGTPVTALVKTVSAGAGTQTVGMPVSTVTLGTQVKTVTPGFKTTNATPQQIRQIQVQQQLAQKKNQKIGFAQVGGKGIATQFIVTNRDQKTTIPAMTVQQLQQVMSRPQQVAVSQGPVVLAKAPGRVINTMNTAQGVKQTIQVVATSTGALNPTILRQHQVATSSAVAGVNTLTHKVGQNVTTAQLISQVSAFQQGQAVAVRQATGSPVRIQTAGGSPIVAVTIATTNSSQSTAEQIVHRFQKKS